MVKARRVRRRLNQDEEAEEAPPGGARTTGGGGYAGAAEKEAMAAVPGLPSAAAAAASAAAVASAAAGGTATASSTSSKKPSPASASFVSPSAGMDFAAAAGRGSLEKQAVTELISPRTNLFSPETWWMVDLEADPPQGATRLVKTCMQAYGWDAQKARAVLRAYRQFLYLKTKYKDYDAKLLSPSRTVDMMWHRHILDVVNYVHDCVLLCGGRVVGHDPRGSEQGPERDERRSATRQALLQHKDEIGIVEEEWKDLLEENQPDSSTTTAVAPAPRSAGATAATAPDKEAFRLDIVLSSGLRRQIKINPDSTRGSSALYNFVASKTGIPADKFRLTWKLVLDSNPISLRAVGLMSESTIYQVLTDAETDIQIIVMDQQGSVIRVDVSLDSGRVSDLYDAASAGFGVQSSDIRLVLDGDYLRNDSTSLRELELMDGDQVDAILLQVGC